MITIKAIEAYMKRRNGRVFSLVLAGALMFSACSSKEESYYEPDQANLGGVAVKGFSLKANSKVLNNLDSVFFSIDLNTARIFNADSLPYGTDVSALAVSLTTDACSKVTVLAPGEEEEIDYLTDESVKINFSKGSVKLHLVSYDGEHSRDYDIKVNVHNVVPDSLYWSEAAYRALPTAFRNPVAQKTVASTWTGQVYCLTTDGADYNMSVSPNPYKGNWYDGTPHFGKDADVSTFTYAEGMFYILADDGELLASTNPYNGWRGTGEHWSSIIGAYGQVRLLGLKKVGDRYIHVSYPALQETVASADFPVSAHSAVVEFTTKWASKPQILFLGGRLADGSLSGATWAYDGSKWAKIGDGMKPAENYSVTRYTITETDTVSWRLKESDVLLAFGGLSEDGVGRDVYLSRDMGITWKKGDKYLQLPEYMPSVYDADLIVFNTPMTEAVNGSDAAAKAWHEVPLKKLPSVYTMPKSRIATPVEDWECPFLYMFGGLDENGVLQNSLWRGVINHFTFRPLE